MSFSYSSVHTHVSRRPFPRETFPRETVTVCVFPWLSLSACFISVYRWGQVNVRENDRKKGRKRKGERKMRYERNGESVKPLITTGKLTLRFWRHDFDLSFCSICNNTNMIRADTCTWTLNWATGASLRQLSNAFHRRQLLSHKCTVYTKCGISK